MSKSYLLKGLLSLVSIAVTGAGGYGVGTVFDRKQKLAQEARSPQDSPSGAEKNDRLEKDPKSQIASSSSSNNQDKSQQSQEEEGEVIIIGGYSCKRVVKPNGDRSLACF